MVEAWRVASGLGPRLSRRDMGGVEDRMHTYQWNNRFIQTGGQARNSRCMPRVVPDPLLTCTRSREPRATALV